jgi:Rad3-related DNA helicase
VKNLVITRIPFAPPDQTIADLISNAMLKKGHSQKKISATIYGISVVSTRRKLRQAIGRGIRQKSDISKGLDW